MCSEQWDIVKSKDWLNLKPENGLDGGAQIFTEEYRAKMRESNKRQGCFLKGFKHSTETKAKMSSDRIGRKHSAETKVKISKPRPAPIVGCPHCSKVGGSNMMHRYHFNNCKLKEK